MREELRNYNIEFTPLTIERDENILLSDEKLVQEVAELYNTKKSLFALILRNRMNKNGLDMLYSCPPNEIEARRLVITELSYILRDLEEVSAEFDRLKASKGGMTNSVNSMSSQEENNEVQDSSV